MIIKTRKTLINLDEIDAIEWSRSAGKDDTTRSVAYINFRSGKKVTLHGAEADELEDKLRDIQLWTVPLTN